MPPQVLRLMGLETSPEEANQLFETVDRNGDGAISVAEFAAYVGKWPVFSYWNKSNIVWKFYHHKVYSIYLNNL